MHSLLRPEWGKRTILGTCVKNFTACWLANDSGFARVPGQSIHAAHNVTNITAEYALTQA